VVKVLDLELCRLAAHPGEKAVTALTLEGTPMGTPEYMAPEQVRDSTQVDIRADLYSLGCTFYFLLTGCRPFRGLTPTEVMFKQCTQLPEPLGALRSGLPPAVVAVVNRLMDKRSADCNISPDKQRRQKDTAAVVDPHGGRNPESRWLPRGPLLHVALKNPGAAHRSVQRAPIVREGGGGAPR
jgi:serine/threonine protein kinase